MKRFAHPGIEVLDVGDSPSMRNGVRSRQRRERVLDIWNIKGMRLVLGRLRNVSWEGGMEW